MTRLERARELLADAKRRRNDLEELENRQVTDPKIPESLADELDDEVAMLETLVYDEQCRSVFR